MDQGEAVVIDYLSNVQVGSSKYAPKSDGISIINAADYFALIMLLVQYFFQASPVRL